MSGSRTTGRFSASTASITRSAPTSSADLLPDRRHGDPVVPQLGRPFAGADLCRARELPDASRPRPPPSRARHQPAPPIFYPIVDTVILSFHSWDGLSPERTYVGLENYRTLLGLDRFHHALGNNQLRRSSTRSSTR